jgi:hypothetical protein
MLISKKYQFIFIHIPKVAGQSITKALDPFATGKWQGKVSLVLSSRVGISQSTLNRLHLYHPHITAEELRTIIGKERFKSYFSFAIVRNPWEWQVSAYNYTLKNPRHRNHKLIKSLGSFEQYLKWLCNQEQTNFCQKKFIFSHSGEQLVKYIGKYERLDQDFKLICSKLGISTELPQLNVYRNKDYKTYYNDKTIQLVRNFCSSDIETFDYDFD